MQDPVKNPIGSVGVPALLCAIAGTVLSFGLHVMGFFSIPEELLRKYWESAPFYLVDALAVRIEAQWVIAFLTSYLVAYFTLGSAFAWRRILIGVMYLLLVLGFSPVLMLWGILWIPIIAGVAVLWTWFCAIMYARQHTMPSEISEPVVLPIEEIPKYTQGVRVKMETIPFPPKKKLREDG